MFLSYLMYIFKHVTMFYVFFLSSTHGMREWIILFQANERDRDGGENHVKPEVESDGELPWTSLISFPTRLSVLSETKSHSIVFGSPASGISYRPTYLPRSRVSQRRKIPDRRNLRDRRDEEKINKRVNFSSDKFRDWSFIWPRRLLRRRETQEIRDRVL